MKLAVPGPECVFCLHTWHQIKAIKESVTVCMSECVCAFLAPH